MDGLRKRLAFQDLQHKKGPSTFFRSIGAVLGYHPGFGSLIGLSNQDNYRFLHSDNKEIIEWINQNLLVGYLKLPDASMQQIKDLETFVIKKYRPVCNIACNPEPLRWLEEKRAECRRIARGR